MCADAVTSTGWSAATAEDALDAIDVLTTALSQTSPETAKALAAAAAATTDARRHLGLPADPAPGLDGKEPAVPVPRTGQSPILTCHPGRGRGGVASGPVSRHLYGALSRTGADGSRE
ncbi:hypothetical protein ACFRKB_37435 [Streptomyces scopuliridis]|uniref:hypothetical protein n=1 Tax=Streptomyces scopuliridis TaxID=452529 RepID=UPI00369F1527